jgi:DNA-binding NarL/FixJ family response regulator
MRPLRLLIVDDHPVVRSGLRAMLATQADFEIVAEAEDGAEAVRLADEHRPDVVLIDLHMPGLDGVHALEEIRALGHGTRSLVLTTYETDADILPAIEAGAEGYLLKDAPHEELFRAIRATAVGESILAPQVAARLLRRLSSGMDDALSRREIDVLQRVSRGDTNKAIARELHIAEATVKSHLLHVFAKLGVADRTAAVTRALERGIIRLEG